jgi:hypothetical protein
MQTAFARRPAGRARAQGAAGPAAGHAGARRAPCAPPVWLKISTVSTPLK